MAFKDQSLVRKVLNYFLQGLLFTVPIVVTFYVLFKVILWIDSLLPFQVPVHIPGFPQIEIPGLGLIVLFTVISLAGYIGTKYIRNPFFRYFERLMERAPLMKLIYSSVKDLISAFVGEKKRFNHPVLVTTEMHSNVQRIGFITNDDLTSLGLKKELVAVYIPFSYSFMGELIIVPVENIKPLDASGTNMMKFIVSGGVTEI